MTTPRERITLITHGDLAVHNPLSVADLEAALAHAGDPAAPDVLAWVDAARARLLAPGGRDTIGFGLVLLAVPRERVRGMFGETRS
jgi:hypothetical protein